MSAQTILAAPAPPPIGSSKAKSTSGASEYLNQDQSENALTKRKRDAGLAVPSSSPELIHSSPSVPGSDRPQTMSVSYNDQRAISERPTICNLSKFDRVPALADAERDELTPDEDNDTDDDDEETGFDLNIEVRLRSNSTILYDTARQSIGVYITENFTCLETHAPVPGWEEIKFIADEVESVCCAESAHPLSLVPLKQVCLRIHVYELPSDGQDKMSMMCANPQEVTETTLDSHGEDEGGDPAEGDVAASRLELPANKLEGIWESLVYDDEVKIKLLNYIYSSVIFAEQDVDQTMIAWHRLLLLHGPPGTGKTSLCKALAQKISIRLSSIYQKTELVEINSHSLFSKWFSESGKLVQSLFTKIGQMADDPDVFVMVLIDEVESLAGSRSTGTSGNEPSDALRAVNALLTELDKLKHRRNVLVLTTSNITGSIDHAFLDRADLKQYIGLPPPEAIYWILSTCLKELVKADILRPRTLKSYKEALMARDGWEDTSHSGQAEQVNVESKIRRSNVEKSIRCSIKLLKISERATGMSGRTLRRLPLLAHARTAVMRSGSKKLTMETYLDGMLAAVEDDKSCTAKLDKDKGGIS